MRVTEFSANAFWKGETEITGTVEEDGTEFHVRLRKTDGWRSECSCGRAGSDGEGRPLCGHALAVLAAYEEKKQKRHLKPVSTSQGVRFMVREYTNREVAKIIEAGEEGEVRLIPRLSLGKQELRLKFFIGKERMYQVKDLVTFARAVKFGRFVEYGKNLSFHHSLTAFAAECRPLVQLLAEMVGVYEEHYEEFQRAPGPEPVLRELILSPGNRERFFALMEGKTLECEDYRRRLRTLTVRAENPRLVISAERAGRDGVKISLPKELMAFMGEHALFIADREAIYRCSEEYTQALAVFMENLVESRDASGEALVNDRDMPLFYERVLKRLDAMGLVETKGVELESYRPQELTARFTFDSPGPGSITMTPSLSYGDFSFHPLDDELVPKTVCRDVPGEFRIGQTITRFFSYAEDGTKDLVIRDDDGAIYRLLDQGMDRFMELGEVLVSESFKKIRLLPPTKVAAHVKVEGSWLNLELDAGGLSGKELLEVLAEYGRKKKFYRMKNGDFLKLDDGGLLTVSRLAKGLDIEKALAGPTAVRLPLYRAVYLDGLLKEERAVTFYRDQLFKTVVRGMREVEDSDFEVPAEFTDVLKGYQKAGFKWLRTLDSYGFGGILADEMGLGKTVQIIALLLDEKEKCDRPPLSLIVCPASLVYNWENEIATFAPGLKVVAAAGSQPEREAFLSGLSEGIESADVVITSYDLLRRDFKLYEAFDFRFQIADEAQYIKNASTQAARAVKTVRARTRFALTGTPIENHLGELWSIFDFLMPGFLFTAQKFKRMFEVPIVRDADEAALSQLRRITGPFILRRLKAEVLKELPKKLETVLYSAMEGEQKRVYQANAAKLKMQIEQSGEFGSEKLEILSELMKLRQICCEPSLCLRGYHSGSAKLETCMELIVNGISAGHKILLFSQFTSMLDIIAARLDREKIGYFMLTGATPKKERMRLVTSFYNGEAGVFLISLKAGGTGLNLTAADIVIHYDPWWNVAAQNQATDRAHRIGQEKQVTVFKLITKHTIEENILLLQEQKKNLADTVVTEGTASFASLTKEELLKMLEA